MPLRGIFHPKAPVENILFGPPYGLCPLPQPPMNTKTTLTLLAASAGLLAFTLPTDEIKFSPSEGTSLSKTFEVSIEASLDDLLLNFNGQEMDPAAMGADFDLSELNGTANFSLSVIDEYIKMDGQRPIEMQRTVETMSAEFESGTGDSDSDSASIEGKTLTYKWNAEEEEYSVSQEGDDEEVDADDLAMFAQDLDLRSLLPADSVSEGDSWTITGADLMSLLIPGLDVAKAITRANEEAGDGDMPIELDEALDLISKDMLLKCTYAGTRRADGRSLMVIELASDFESNIDLSDMILEAIEANMPPEMSLDLSVVIDLAAEAEGEVIWDAAAGHFVTMTLEIDVVAVIDASGGMDAGGQEMAGGIEAEASIHYELSASAE